jgi:hypothetical protein
MKTLQETILKRLAVREPVGRRTLLQYLKAKGFKTNDRVMRDTISRMRIIGGHLIASSLKGYKLANTAKEFERHIDFKKSYAMAILKECKAMQRNFKRATKPQLFA